jgi:hypothetical protein
LPLVKFNPSNVSLPLKPRLTYFPSQSQASSPLVKNHEDQLTHSLTRFNLSHRFSPSLPLRQTWMPQLNLPSVKILSNPFNPSAVSQKMRKVVLKPSPVKSILFNHVPSPQTTPTPLVDSRSLVKNPSSLSNFLRKSLLFSPGSSLGS